MDNIVNCPHNRVTAVREWLPNISGIAARLHILSFQGGRESILSIYAVYLFVSARRAAPAFPLFPTPRADGGSAASEREKKDRRPFRVSDPFFELCLVRSLSRPSGRRRRRCRRRRRRPRRESRSLRRGRPSALRRGTSWRRACSRRTWTGPVRACRRRAA